MLSLLPQELPPLRQLLDNIGRPGAHELAKAFEVPERTAASWVRKGSAPRAVLLALFWVSDWGRTAADSESHSLAKMRGTRVPVLQGEADRLRGELARVLTHARFETANDPTMVVTATRGRPLAKAPALHRLRLLPRKVPQLATLLDDLYIPNRRALATALGTSERTVARWVREGTAPRAVMLALFWATRWGQSAAYCHVRYMAQLLGQRVRALQDEVQRLRGALARVLACARFSPVALVPDSRTPAQVHQMRRSPAHAAPYRVAR